MGSFRRRLALAGLGLISLGASGVAVLALGDQPTGALEQDVGERVSRARADLRTIHTALESYRVDWAYLPETLHALTTPIAYITRVPVDPFAESPYSELAPDATEEELHYRVTYDEDYTHLLVYSIGPDGADDEARAEYDPANGVISAGDIIRRVELGDFVMGLDPETMDKIGASRAAAQTVARNLRLWAMENKRMPANWDEVRATDPRFPVLADPFAPGEVLLYAYDPPIARIYSRGPNGIDNGGWNNLRGSFTGGEVPEADIVETVDWREIAVVIERIENPTLENTDDSHLKALLELREATGRDNALIYYQMASLVSPGVPSQEEDTLIWNALRHGWSAESEAVMPYLRSWEPAFARIREGVARNNAYGIGYDQGHETTVPNFLAIQLGARMLTVEGRRQESLGNLDQAIEEYRTALHMSRDIGVEGGFLISSLISIANQYTVLLGLRDLITSGKLDAAQLARVQEMLHHIEDTHAGVAAGMEGERAAIAVSLVKEAERVLATSDEEFAKEAEDFIKQLAEEGLVISTRLDLVELFELTRRELDAYWQKSIEHASHEPHEAPRLNFDAMIAEMKSPLARYALPNITEASTRDYTMIARRRLALTETALELYRLGFGEYPASLDTLDGETIRRLPIDPFSGSAMRYRLGGDGAAYTLYSLGPDKTDSVPPVKYDPTNGTLSPGNIY